MVEGREREGKAGKWREGERGRGGVRKEGGGGAGIQSVRMKEEKHSFMFLVCLSV